MSSRVNRGAERALPRAEKGLPTGVGVPVPSDFPIQAEFKEVERIWRAVRADELSRTMLAMSPDRISESPIFANSWSNGTLFLGVKLKAAFVHNLSPKSQRELLKIYSDNLGLTGTLQLDDDELILDKPDGSFERIATLPSLKTARSGQSGPRRVDLGPLSFVMQEMDSDELHSQPFFSFHAREQPITSLVETEMALRRFATLVQGYLSVVAKEHRLTLPRDKIIFDGKLIEDSPAPDTETPAGMMMAHAQMSRRELERLLQPKDVAPVAFADVRGQAAAVEQMRRLALQIKGRQGTAADWPADLPTGVLLIGPPGNGKTMLAAATAQAAEAGFLVAKTSHIFRGLWGDTEQRADWLLEIAREKAAEHPSGACILLLDEVDSIAESREAGGFSGGRSALNLILTNLSGLGSDHSVIAVATSNLPQLLDKAFLDRMDMRVPLPLPDVTGRAEILIGRMAYYARRTESKLFGEVDSASVARRTDGFSGRKLNALVNRAIADKGVWQLEHGQKPQPISTADFLYIIQHHSAELDTESRGSIGYR